MKKIKTINLFVACSSTSEFLNDQKEELVGFCKELNIEFANKNISYTISPVSYEDPESRKDVFDRYLRKADIIIFLVDNVRDDVLVSEFKKAVKRNNIFNQPEVLVFASNQIEENEAFNKEIKQICADGGWLYEPLKNTDDLKDNVKEKIYRYVRSYERIKEIRIWSKRRYYGLNYGLPFLVVLLVLSIMLGLYYYKSWKMAESKKLLIVGGGSAKNYIEEKCLNKNSLVKLNPDIWWYAPMPSGDAYRMISEEIINLEGDYKNRPYYPIIISAEKAERDTLFRRTIDPGYFSNKGYVIGIHIGDDYLVAYSGNNAFDDYINDTSLTILETDLDNIIREQASLLSQKDLNIIPIYTTNKNSGTLNAYLDKNRNNDKSLRPYHVGLNSYLKVRDSLRLGYVFSSIDTLSKQNPKTKWIALGSKYYHPEAIFDMDSLVVLDSCTRRPIYKPIYVYFLLYNDNNSYRLPAATKDFLYAINVPPQIIDSINDPYRINEMINKNPTTVLYDDFHVEKK